MSDPAGHVQANPARRREISPAPIRKSVVVHAPAARAFAFFTSGMDRWWRPEHHIATNPFAEIVMEPRAGGRWFERDRDGAECEWGKVLVWNPPEQVVLAWQLNADWRYDPDFITELEVRFIPQGYTKTRVELEHRGLEKFGAKADAVRASLDSPEGWNGAVAEYASRLAAEAK
jgi:hypothetical protein